MHGEGKLGGRFSLHGEVGKRPIAAATHTLTVIHNDMIRQTGLLNVSYSPVYPLRTSCGDVPYL